MVRQARYRNATLDRFSPEMELRVCFAGELVRGSAEVQKWEDLAKLLEIWTETLYESFRAHL
jgi:hypothetical protein